MERAHAWILHDDGELVGLELAVQVPEKRSEEKRREEKMREETVVMRDRMELVGFELAVQVPVGVGV